MKVVLVSAVSLDGKIARNSLDKLDWVSSDNKEFFGRVSRKAGVAILGRKTFEAIGRPLRERLIVVLTSRPKEKESIKGKVEFTNQEVEEVLSDLESRGFSEVVVGGGRKVNSLFLRKKLIDEIRLVFEPVVLGEGIGLFEEGAPFLKFKLLDEKKLGNNLVAVRYGRR